MSRIACKLRIAIIVVAKLIMGIQVSTLWAQDSNFPPQSFQMPNETAQGLASQFPLTSAQRESGWIALFDGKTLLGWKAESKVDWTVSGGTIVATQGEVGLLRTTSQFDDYELTLEFMCPNSTNSGVFLRTSPRPKNPAGDCYELNIAPPSNPFPTGSLVGRKLSKAPRKKYNSNTWHQMHLTVRGNQIQASVDGAPTVNFHDLRPLGRGYIGLQFNSGTIAFRNIALKPLSLENLLDAGLANWDVSRAGASQFNTRPSVGHSHILEMTNGPGQIETKSTFADFIFQSNCKTEAAGLNSGVFFRCIPSEKMNGYESQIQNQFENGNPNEPTDCGTGGIFRRRNARTIAAIDQNWFSKTIVATGPHISVWVNGLQVVDWTDTRKPNKNPRKGKRLEAGTIILQGHDPTTNILFSKIKIKELSARRPTQKRSSN